METKLYKIENPDCLTAADCAALKKAGEIIRCGGLVAFPTETVYGLGANALDSNAVPKIFKAKGRPSDNPLIVHISDPGEAERYVYTTPLFDKIAGRFMPGPISVIQKKRDCIPSAVSAGLDTAAVRCPSNKVAHAFLKAAGVPVAAPSANTSGKPSPTKAEHVVEDMDGKIDMIIDGGECDCGVESTVINASDGRLTVLRPGSVTPEMLASLGTEVCVAAAVTAALKDGEKALSPGMKYKHYAPKTPVVLLDGDEAGVSAFLADKVKNENCAVLCYDGEYVPQKVKKLIIGAQGDDAAQAHRLFSLLREADSLDADVIYAHLPDKNGVSLALYNRMIRASAYTVIKVSDNLLRK